MKNTFFIFAAIIFALLLSVGGVYMIIDSFFNDTSLFQAIVILSLGMIITLILTLLTNIGKAIDTFAKVFEQQVKMQEQITSHFNRPISKNPLADILSRINPSESSITVTNLDTGDSTTQSLDQTDSISGISKIIMDSMINSKKNNEKSLTDLEKKLADAVANDDFEKAKEIRDIIKELDNQQDKDNDENN